jgi:hypothetical protein
MDVEPQNYNIYLVTYFISSYSVAGNTFHGHSGVELRSNQTNENKLSRGTCCLALAIDPRMLIGPVY